MGVHLNAVYKLNDYSYIDCKVHNDLLILNSLIIHKSLVNAVTKVVTGRLRTSKEPYCDIEL